MKMASRAASSKVIRFGVFEIDHRAGELRKNGLRVKLTGQPFEVLGILLERPGEVITREEIRRRLWPADTFVDFEHSVNTAIKRVREVLGDSADSPRFVQTLPRRGYRFIAPVEGAATPETTFHDTRRVPRTLTRLTFDAGLQLGATWSPDGRFIAYSSDRGGKFDVWVQPVSGGDAVQVTKGPGHNWQPDWSPDGKLIAFRSERAEGGLYVVPVLGGHERKLASFGYRPRWSPNGSQVLFGTAFSLALAAGKFNRLYVVNLDGGPPREVLAEFLAQHDLRPLAAVWHPDSKRISVGIPGCEPAPTFWVVPLDAGPAIKSEIAPGVVNGITEAAANGFKGSLDSEFSWAPSGNAVYFERKSGGAGNLWKAAIDPENLRITGIERLTTGAGPDTDFALSPDGKRLAFTARAQYTRVWVFPFDAVNAQVTGAGQAVTSPGMVAFGAHLSRDSRKLAYSVERGGNWELRVRSLSEEREASVAADDHYIRHHPRWSPDGTRLAYTRVDPKNWRGQLCIWSAEIGNEEPLTTLGSPVGCVYDWSPDGEWLLASQGTGDTDVRVPPPGAFPGFGICRLPVAAAPHAEMSAQNVVNDSAYSLYQAHFSPDGGWIVFEAAKNAPNVPESVLCVVPACGGRWTRITDGKSWDDKPRWSPDGHTIYFLSGRSGFFDVWGVHFDPAGGGLIGEPFRITSFESPRLRVSEPISFAGLSISHDRLALTLTESSGSIWMLDNVDR